jgi:formylmethanofuran dehydrogenase subunit E
MSDERKSLVVDEFLEEAGRFHGHTCAGIACGVRMAVEGLARLGIGDPRGEDRKRFVVFVEADRCATDAIMVVTGCTPGKRSLKVLDHGKMAATFVDVETGRGVRLAALPWPDRAQGDPPQDYARGEVATLFHVAEVLVPLRPVDLPGPSQRRTICARCGEQVMDGRDVERDGATLCRPCATGVSFYRAAGALAGR